MNTMKRVSLSPRSRTKLVHVEAPGCIVNIRQGLHDSDGREVTSVEVICDQYAGEASVTIPDLLTPEQVADEIGAHYGIFDCMDRQQTADHFRELAAGNKALNVRVVRDNPA